MIKVLFTCVYDNWLSSNGTFNRSRSAMLKRLKYLKDGNADREGENSFRFHSLFVGGAKDEFAFFLVDRQFVRVDRIWKVSDTNFKGFWFVIARENRLNGCVGKHFVRSLVLPLCYFRSFPTHSPHFLSHRNFVPPRRSICPMPMPSLLLHSLCGAICELETNVLFLLRKETVHTEQNVGLCIVFFDHFTLIIEGIMDFLSV